ncbi:uncharacterized protein LOC113555670 [Rhopalosiphum maidis]|uniref:uncharacterized protein LOC113555670 n=1 Tax=Rhopalosiphum maidis TaxID=43146 RepID=UPI000EFDEA6C|nr:uncharacterized protein LOC113555670 [Rhopalosiphum maidis]
MNKKEGIMNGEFSSNNSNINLNSLSEENSCVTIDLTEDHEPIVDNSPENYIQEINVEEVYIDELIVEKINLRKYTKKQRAKNPEDFFINSLGGFKYILKKTSDLRNNISSYSKMKNFNSLDTMLLKNKLNPSTCADESTSLEYHEDEPLYEISCVDESDTNKEVESNTVVIFSKRIHEEESSFYGETSRNIKRQRNLNRVEEESNSISSFNETDTDDVLYSIINIENEVLNHEEEYNMDRFVDYNYTSETERAANDKHVLMQVDNFINDSQDTDEIDNCINDGQNMNEKDKNVMNNVKGIDKNLPIFSVDDDDDDEYAEINKPKQSKIFEAYHLNVIHYIESDRQDIIFPGYSKEIFTELFNFITNKTITDKLHSDRCCSCTMGDLINVFFPKLWINDMLIEHYFRLLVKNCKDELIVSLDSLFIIIFKAKGFEVATNSIKGPIKNVLDCDKVIIPTHVQGNHWAFTLVEIKKLKITYYDSIKSSTYQNEMTSLVTYLNEAYDKHKKPGDKESVSWSLFYGDCPSQTNDYDCGVFACTNARHAVLGKKVKYTQEDAPLLRHRITYEIIHDVLLPTVSTPDTEDTPDIKVTLYTVNTPNTVYTSDTADTPDTKDTPDTVDTLDTADSLDTVDTP